MCRLNERQDLVTHGSLQGGLWYFNILQNAAMSYFSSHSSFAYYFTMVYY